ncbi:pseudouridine synthase [Parafilimonas sp.]|uniref:pseudouridine synthase n=1 Tax=Parafilimonas sp. TaxID=1969739 RepID=UPI0039E3A349
MFRYFIIYKPYKTLSQFTSSLDNKKTLADYFAVPKNVYPVGRLDEDSEGLLILTNDAKLNHRLLNPFFAHEREYWAQVEGSITNDAVMQMQQGLQLNIKSSLHQTKESVVTVFSEAPVVAKRMPPVRYRANIPTSWIKIILKEGKNRQVRKMTAKTGFPTLRLIRYRIEDITLDNMQPGAMIELSQKSIYKKLFYGNL